MNKLVKMIAVLVLASAAQGGSAQPPAGDADVPPQARQRAEQRLEEIMVRLELTEQQQQQVRPIMQSAMEQRRAVREAHGVGPGKGKPDAQTRQAMRGEMQAIKADTDQQLAEVLSAEQMQELRDIRREIKQEMRARYKQYQQQQGQGAQ